MYYSDCYYYYNSSTNRVTIELSAGAKAGVAVGVIVFIVGIALLIWCCCRKRNQPQLAPQSNSFGADNTNIIVQPGGYNQPTPAYGQPVFGQPTAYGADPFAPGGYGNQGGQPTYINV
jgi:hypothetical protein